MNGIEGLKLMLESRSTDYGKMRQILSMYLLNNDKVVSDLRAKLKVAEDALVVCKDSMCGECHRQHPGCTCVCPNGCYEMSMAKNALAAIREEGGAK